MPATSAKRQGLVGHSAPENSPQALLNKCGKLYRATDFACRRNGIAKQIGGNRVGDDASTPIRRAKDFVEELRALQFFTVQFDLSAHSTRWDHVPKIYPLRS